MRATIDNTIELEQEHIEIGGWRRDRIEKIVAGLDGVVSVDLGRRSRVLIQKCVISAANESALGEKIDTVESLVDSNEHALVLKDGKKYENLLVDEVSVLGMGVSGRGANGEIEIRYTQLRRGE